MFRILRRLVALAFVACLALVGLGAWFATKPTPTTSPTPAPSPSSPIASATTPAAEQSPTPPPVEQSTTSAPVEATTEPQPKTTPSTTSPNDPAAELLAEAGDIHRDIIDAATYVHREQSVPSSALRATVEDIKAGDVLYLAEGADVLGPIGKDALQLSLANGTTAFLVGVDASAVVSGNRITPGLVHVRPAAQYTTVIGATRSGWVLRAIPETEWTSATNLAAAKIATERRDEQREQLTKATEELEAIAPQPFTSADGKYTTTATIEAIEAGAYIMRRDDGKEIRVEDAKLDEASQFRARSALRRVLALKKQIEQITDELAGDPSQARRAD
jgi:hypothetical protein